MRHKNRLARDAKQSPAGLSEDQGQLRSRERAAKGLRSGLPKTEDKSIICGATAASLNAAAGQVAADPFRAAAQGAQPPPPVRAPLRQARALSLVLNGAAVSVPSPGSARSRVSFSTRGLQTSSRAPTWVGGGPVAGACVPPPSYGPLRPGALRGAAGTRRLGTASRLKGKTQAAVGDGRGTAGSRPGP